MSVPSKVFNIVFVVAHPDDEAIWIGGLLSELSRLDFLRVHVICLTGGADVEKRGAEFCMAQAIGGYQSAYLAPVPVPKDAHIPLPNIGVTIEASLAKLNLVSRDVSILITHSPFGDEHGHPHHIQTYHELYAWTRLKQVPFGYFANALIPYFDLTPVTQNLGKIGDLYLLFEAKCRNNLSLVRRLFSQSVATFHTPKRYLSFISTGSQKEAMLHSYQSEVKKIKEGYTAASHAVEGIYIIDEVGILPFHALISHMEVPGRKKLFPV